MKKRILPALLALVLAVSLAVPALAADSDWKSAYATAIQKEADSWGNIFQLADLDVDGTPELIIGGVPGSGLFSEILAAYTWKNGSLQELNVQEYMMLSTNYTSCYDLYRNNTTGAYRIEGSYTLRAGMGYYSSITACYSLSNNCLTNTEPYVTSVSGTTTTYYVNGSKTTASKYTSAYNGRNSGWTKVSTFVCKELDVYWKKPTSSQVQEFLDSYPAGPALAQSSTHNIQVDGKPVSIAAYGINGNNYFKLRDLAALLSGTQAQFQVGWNADTWTITLTTGQSYTAVGGELAKSDGLNRFGNPTNSPVYVDGVLTNFTAYNIGGNNYFKLRDLGQALGFNVTWDDATRTVSILTDQDYSE